MKRNGAIALLLALISATNAPASAETSVPVPISLWYIDCTQNLERSGLPRVTALDWMGHLIVNRTFPSIGPNVIRELDLTLIPGFYQVGVTNGKCSSNLMVTILPNRSRSLVAVGRTGLSLENPTAMLAGTLPSPGWRVAIDYPDRTAIRGLGSDSSGHLEITAVVEGDAYYATTLPEGRIFLRLYNQRLDRWFDFDAGRIDLTLGKGRSALIRNITKEELSSAIKRQVP
jgi:hypothetical protein